MYVNGSGSVAQGAREQWFLSAISVDSSVFLSS